MSNVDRGQPPDAFSAEPPRALRAARLAPDGSVEALLRFAQSVHQQRLGRVRRAGDDPRHVVYVVEGRQDVVGNAPPIPAARPPDTDTKTGELLRPECLGDRPQPIVAAEST